ncbi:hypothetical protein PUN28_010832 [Cardiocondyla obscurior]|uniref:Uncharacterized protein n=1 Tax=Cardiocondyla obscurior TaxID=286306 RepID=A0AAW2FKH9_9HYME
MLPLLSMLTLTNFDVVVRCFIEVNYCETLQELFGQNYPEEFVARCIRQSNAKDILSEMTNQIPEEVHIRHYLRFEFYKGSNIALFLKLVYFNFLQIK